ncbi:ElyC/SanA/YdcF family protein [Thalassotalea maritima]|uniref:ElyC/SanA/YdcF family protein n=1 Tax=Thalassotalea maritima TaxID=3242416 RepID=UPI003527C14B
MDTFLLKKFIAFFLQPQIIVIVVLILAFIARKKYHVQAKIISLCALLALYLLATKPVSEHLIETLEGQYPVYQQQVEKLDYIVVLGCGHSADKRLAHSQQLKTCSLQRMVEGLRIANLHPEATIVTSGAAMTDNVTNAQMVKDALIELGYSGNIIAIEQARDTEEEAIYLTPLLTHKQFALVTNASDIPRAMTFFQQRGLAPIAAPTGFRAKHSELNWRVIAPHGKHFETSELFFYEFIGQVWQLIKMIFAGLAN